ncbi:GTPase Era [Lyticum sinuosum]|uniref:GTPase Era n=1 Tax=Lyticum sinuosum TaxID=1332059 RepID=A0AAE4VLK7_9RICK|nr:GTPase Era [Lyticum sinuosum]MDZ5761051.1 GTPase Era [Lyticum sinuosum]
MDTKTSVVAIIGQPNSGKSTLLNYLMKDNLSIVTNKVQTTRFSIKGILNYENTQLVLIDTPGLFEPRQDHLLEKYIVKNAINSIKYADILVFLLDIMQITRVFRNEITYLNQSQYNNTDISPNKNHSDIDNINQNQLKDLPQSPEMREFIDINRTLMKKNRKNSPLIFAVNKFDLYNEHLKHNHNNFAIYPNKHDILKIINYIKKDFHEIHNISATSGDGIENLISSLCQISPQGEWNYDCKTDLTPQKIAEEITREQIYLQLNKELPYSIHIYTESWNETIDKIVIKQAICVIKNSQKVIVIGENGKRIKEIGISSREKISLKFNKNIDLFLFVKVKPDWIKQLSN